MVIGSVASDATTAPDEERLAPGGFGLRYAFSQWSIKERSTDSSSGPSRNTSRSTDQEARERPLFRGSTNGSSSDRHRSRYSVTDVLKYVKRAFGDEAFLNELPSEAAVNAGAWKAWRAHRRRSSTGDPIPVGKDVSPQVTKSQAKHPDEWSWDGVWEARVRKGIDTSISDQVLFGTGGDDEVFAMRLSD
ncbi:MAG: hypothetical protein Q9174_003861 [Haloplaca sp. 1 TL-2023]